MHRHSTTSMWNFGKCCTTLPMSAAKSTASKLGWWIRRHAGRIVNGRRFVRGSGNRSAEAWQVESVSPVSCGDFVTRLIQIDANYAFNARWSWVNLIQYDNESGSVGENSQLRWNPREGQDLYIVLNHGFDAVGFFQVSTRLFLSSQLSTPICSVFNGCRKVFAATVQCVIPYAEAAEHKLECWIC